MSHPRTAPSAIKTVPYAAITATAGPSRATSTPANAPTIAGMTAKRANCRTRLWTIQTLAFLAGRNTNRLSSRNSNA